MSSVQQPPKRPTRETYHHGDLASELLQAARLVLAENGLESFSLRTVAKRAGVSHGAPAHHFKDVNGLLTELAALGYEHMAKMIEARQIEATVDPELQIVAAGIGYIDFAIENPSLFRLMFSSERPDRNNARFAEASMTAFDLLVTHVSNLFGLDLPNDPMAMRQVMTSWALVHGLAELVISGRAEIPLGFGQLTKAEREIILSDIMLRALKSTASG